MVREAQYGDLNEILNLYLHLHETSVPEESENLKNMWDEIMANEAYHLIVYEKDGKIVSSCVCVIVPNLTRKVRKYALIENVVTHKGYRGKGYATQCLDFAKKIAVDNNCYKLMRITGSQEETTLQFYKNAGYSSDGKTAFVQWME